MASANAATVNTTDGRNWIYTRLTGITPSGRSGPEQETILYDIKFSV
jgi:hypothetical protein